ncbi:ATP-binding protein [Streptomyces sp. ISL-100]|uniref:ATP-binding protein n=1 Tax=Streptomyces sp. ISL-100 TaxID=2819173 RepID=UPI001BE64C47|nr:ATP-binding protein [Streptomyces sp. ISL-100]MBT2395804.1 ATP-binding protein [Streptomyces sp. ISL-100]
MVTPALLLHLELLALPKAVPEARRAVREHLGAPCADVQLCVSELLTNVITHVGEGTPVTLRVSETRDRRTTRVEVTDPDPRALPVHLKAAADAESGRGMALLAAVALRWGIRQGADSKTVWCELSSVGDRPEW